MALRITVNGEERTVDADPDMPLLWALRDHLQLTGTKFGCGIAACGACTVHMDGFPVRACSIAVGDVEGSEITTIEGLASPAAKAVQSAWQDLDVVQCGYCQSGQIMAASHLLANTAKPSDLDIDEAMEGNVCRCVTYHRIRKAIHRASEIMEG